MKHNEPSGTSDIIQLIFLTATETPYGKVMECCANVLIGAPFKKT